MGREPDLAEKKSDLADLYEGWQILTQEDL
jgi:hypothetical protein